MTIQKGAEPTGMDRSRVSRIEQGKIKEIKPDEFVALRVFYSQQLGRLVSTNEILEFDPNNKRAIELAVA